MRYAKFDTEILDENPKTPKILDAYVCEASDMMKRGSYLR
jgi:hypothetical protein